VTGSILNHIVANPPPVGARIEFFRLGGAESMELADLWARAGRLALALRGLGVGRGDRVGILAGNSVEWVLLDLAALRMGAVTVGFDPAKFPVDDALIGRYGLRLLFAAGQGGAPGVLPTSDVWRLIDSSTPDKTLPVIGYAPDDVTTVKLTSGSTGEPKGLTTSAGSIDSALHAVQEMFAHGPGDNLFVFLPLAVLQQRYWIYSALRFGHDVTVSTYEAAFPALGRARPTVVMGVPGFFDTARRHIEAQARRAGPAADPDEAVRGAATRLFGDRIRYLWTGSAPAAAGTLRFFTDAGLPIFEGYGLNETCIVSKNHPGANRVGSVGRMLPGKEVVLDADGVISVRSDHPVCHGYEYAAPGVSQRVFGADGVVRTGDLGHIDEDGFLFILGRADDVIVLDNGRKVVVRPIEEHLKASPAIEECVLFCPTQTYLVAVVSPAAERADEPAIAAQLERTNAAFGDAEQIRRVVVARGRFSVENDLLTSQFKPKRRQILDVYRAAIHDNQGGVHAV
jgi:long-subunit acyl-CoA synthetase (AMP-forming)